jgi:signal transduction histidine kinase
MTRQQLDRAQERFYRGRSGGDGFGLGLTIANDAARAAGATLELESTPGKGTRARLTLSGARLLGPR